MPFAPSDIKNLVQAAITANKFKDGILPNKSPLMKKHPEELSRIAKRLGIDFEQTEFTYKSSDKGKYLNAPEIKADGSRPVIEWGKVRKPLAEVIKEANKGFYITFEKQANTAKGGNRFSVNFECKNGGGTYEFRIATDKLTSPGKLQTAFDNVRFNVEGGEAEFASMLLQKPQAVSVLPVGTYQVVGFKTLGKGGYSITLDNGYSYYANSEIKKTLNCLPLPTPENPVSPDINPECPAELKVLSHGTWEKKETKEIYPTAQVDFKLFADKALLEEMEEFTPYDDTESLTPSTGVDDFSDIAF